MMVIRINLSQIFFEEIIGGGGGNRDGDGVDKSILLI